MEKKHSSLGEVSSGLTTLNTKLNGGANSIGEVQTSEENAAFIANPVVSENKDTDKAANNGTSMAPYMMSVALFVGTLTVGMIFDMYNPKKRASSGVAWWAIKMSILGLMAIIQATLVYAIMTGWFRTARTL